MITSTVAATIDSRSMAKYWPCVGCSRRPNQAAAIPAPTQEPARPISTVSQNGIGSGPGTAQRARAPAELESRIARQRAGRAGVAERDADDDRARGAVRLEDGRVELRSVAGRYRQQRRCEQGAHEGGFRAPGPVIGRCCTNFL